MARGDVARDAVQEPVSDRNHRHWAEGTRSALVAAEYALLVALVSIALLVVLYLLVLASL